MDTQSTVIDFSGNIKSAALYFEHVVPAFWYSELLWEPEINVVDGSMTMLDQVIERLWPPTLDRAALNAALVISRSETLPWPEFLSVVESSFLVPLRLAMLPRLLPQSEQTKQTIEQLNAQRRRYHLIPGPRPQLVKLDLDLIPTPSPRVAAGSDGNVRR